MTETIERFMNLKASRADGPGAKEKLQNICLRLVADAGDDSTKVTDEAWLKFDEETRKAMISAFAGLMLQALS